MENVKWVFMDGYDEVIESESRTLVLKTNEIKDKSVIDKVVLLNNDNKSIRDIYYLLEEELCTQEEREFITESIYKHMNPFHKP